jgi:DNA-binding MarR family transcriptional regulator
MSHLFDKSKYFHRLPHMALEKDLQRVEAAMERLHGIGRSRSADSRRRARAGVNLPQGAQLVLRCVAENGPSRISDLAQATQTGDAAVSRQVTLLEEAGLLRRAASAEDGRVAMVHATAEGRRVSRRLRKAADAIFQEHLAGWTRRDLAQLANGMERLARDLRAPHSLGDRR